VSVPKQSIGLTNFKFSISKCPPNPDAIRSIVFSKCDNLAVVNGPSTEILIPLTDFFVPVDGAARITFSVPAKSETYLPYSISKLDFGGVDLNGEVKFIALFPQYGKEAGGNSMYLEWASVSSIEEGQLFVTEPLGATGYTSFNFSNVNKLEFSWGGYLDYTNNGSGSIFAATDGGLFEWTGEKSKLWNTLNSNSVTDNLRSLDVDSFNNLWIASDYGVLKYNPSTSLFSQLYTTSNSQLASDSVNDIKLFGINGVVAATDNGISIFDTTGTTFSTYNIYNSPLLKHEKISTVSSDGTLIFAGTTGGVYVFNTSDSKWSKYPLNSTNVNGWSAPDSVTSIANHDNVIYVGTTGGLVVLPYVGVTGATSSPIIGLTASVILGGGTGPYSSNFSSLRIENYGGSYELYTGHDAGGISAYDISSNSWYFASAITGATGGAINDVLPDYLSGSVGSKTFFTGNSEGSGVIKVSSSPFLTDTVPGNGDLTNILLTVPKGNLSGNYSVNTENLFSVDQSMIFLFSKDMTGGATSSTFENFATLKEGISGSGATVSGSWNWNNLGKVATFTPSSNLERAQGYNLRIAMGSTASDNSFVSEGLNVGFYTEDISPVLGWEKLGKMLVLSGSDNNFIEGLYLRNPQSTDVNVIALIGR